ncbi:hypothetical protein ACFL59_08815, partial [Planctomycetota bacterium]
NAIEALIELQAHLALPIAAPREPQEEPDDGEGWIMAWVIDSEGRSVSEPTVEALGTDGAIAGIAEGGCIPEGWDAEVPGVASLGLPAGRYELRAYAADLGAGPRRAVTIEAGRTVEVVLTTGRDDGGWISGRFRAPGWSEETCFTVAACPVAAGTGAERLATVTAGGFRLGPLEAGVPYLVVPILDETLPLEWVALEVTLQAGEERVLDVHVPEAARVELNTPRIVGVLVHYAVDHEVWVCPSFSNDQPPGRTSVEVLGLPLQLQAQCVGDPAGCYRLALTLEPAPGETLSVAAAPAAGAASVRGFTAGAAWLSGPGITCELRPDHGFCLERLPAGNYRISASKTGAEPALTFELAAGEERSLGVVKLSR